jgi:hypothetical protein
VDSNLAHHAECAVGVGHELLLTRRLLDIFGGTLESSSRVFGVFFLGLALGSAAGSGLARRCRRAWLAVVAAEVWVVIALIPALLLPWWSEAFWYSVGTERLAGGGSAWLKAALTIAAVFPPAFALGLPLTFLSAAVVGLGGGRACNAWLYAGNTCGGALGVVALIPWGLGKFGVNGCSVILMGLNLALAGLACTLRRGVAGSSVASCPGVRGPSETFELGERLPLRPNASHLVLAFFSGAGVLSIEVIGLQLLSLVATTSLLAPAAVLFATMVTLGIAAIAGAALAVAADRRRLGARRDVDRLIFDQCGISGKLPIVEVATGGALLTLGPVLLMSIARVPHALDVESVSGAAAQLGGLTVLVLGPGLFAAGLLFPSLISGWGRSPAQLGALLAFNGLGARKSARRCCSPRSGHIQHLAPWGLGTACWPSWCRRSCQEPELA